MVTANGAGGELRLAGRVAATLGAWTLQRSEGGAVLTATLATQDAYWLSQGERFELRLPLGNVRLWRWRRATVRLDGNRATIHMEGNPEA
jgi:hypothetical protein